jgi:hypothetical protein
VSSGHRYLWLAAATVATAVATLPAAHGTSWHYFDDAARLLAGRAPAQLGPGGLDLYHSHPEFQFGPLAVVAALGLWLVAGAHAALLAQLLMLPLPIALTWLLEDSARQLGRTARASWFTAAAGTAMVVSWMWLGLFTTHIDDALALTALVIALNMVSRQRALPAGVAIGLAVAAKPWAIILLPVLVAVPRRRLTAASVAVFVGVGCWMPFVLADHATISALSAFTIENSPVSALRAMEVETPRTPPWDRAAQTCAGLLVVALAAIRRDRWPAALLAGIGMRLALDPGTHHYYTTGFVLAGLAWDLLVSPYEWPIASWAALLLLEVPRLVLPSGLAGAGRLLVTVVAVALALVGPLASSLTSRAPSSCQVDDVRESAD